MSLRADSPVAAIFIGIQGSGKSAYYHAAFADRYAHINLDMLHTRSKENRFFLDCIAQRKCFVVDNTNPTRADRARYIPAAKAAGYRIVGYFFESKLQDCIARNEQRTGKARIPAMAIAATSNKMEMPSWDEGFDELYFVKFSDTKDLQTGKNK